MDEEAKCKSKATFPIDENTFSDRMRENLIENIAKINAEFEAEIWRERIRKEVCVHACWISLDSDDTEEYCCSKCGRHVYLNAFDGAPIIEDFHYCPNCGAKMDMEERIK